jgi:selenocysteine-specific elongation factor
MIVGTAGHIDHGKTALVKALTGVDADRLAEEKARSITIDLGYAYTPLPGGEILGFVDVPGHEKFIHNMLAGTTGMDFALLVIAADDGPMPQTVEHLQIVDLLGIRQGAVALTKIDRVDAERIAEVNGEIQALLLGTRLAGCPVLPVSAVTGTGVAELRAHLEAAAGSLGKRIVRGAFRLAADRCFTIAGAGTVVTGTVFSGSVRVGDRLLLSPSGRPVRVRGIHAQNRAAETGLAGQRCALNLADVERSEVQRGDWVLAPELHRPTRRLDVRLALLAGEPRPLQHWTPVHVHLAAFHATGRVALLQDTPLEPGGSALAQLVLDKPTCAVNGDRFILRDGSAQRTLAGGKVLDAQLPARGRRTPQRRAILPAWEEADPRAQLQALLAVSPDGVDLGAFAANANLTGDELEPLCRSLDLRRVEGARALAFAGEHWPELRSAVIEALRQEHEAASDSLGLNAEQLRLRTAPRIERAAFAVVLAELLEAGYCAREGSWWHLPGHALVLAEQDEVLWQRLAPLLRDQPYQPPRVRDIARAESLDEAAVRKQMVQAARMGRVYRVAHDHYFDRSAVAALADIVRELAREAPDGTVSAARFRDAIGTGRKLAIHILEYFDRIGLTRRVGDAHRLRGGSVDF